VLTVELTGSQELTAHKQSLYETSKNTGRNLIQAEQNSWHMSSKTRKPY